MCNYTCSLHDVRLFCLSFLLLANAGNFWIAVIIFFFFFLILINLKRYDTVPQTNGTGVQRLSLGSTVPKHYTNLTKQPITVDSANYMV